MVSYVFGVHHTSCHPGGPYACRWIYVREVGARKGTWVGRAMSAQWDKDDGGRLLAGGRQIELRGDDGTWWPTLLDGWQPVPGDGWLADVREIDHTGEQTVPAERVRRIRRPRKAS